LYLSVLLTIHPKEKYFYEMRGEIIIMWINKKRPLIVNKRELTEINTAILSRVGLNKRRQPIRVSLKFFNLRLALYI